VWRDYADGNFWVQALDNKTLSRLENAVAKSTYVGAGKKLKVTNKVRPSINPIIFERD
jgi:hypothetical protein